MTRLLLRETMIALTNLNAISQLHVFISKKNYKCYVRLLLAAVLRSRSRRFSGGVGVGFLTTLGVGVGVGLSCPAPTPEIQLDHFLHRTLRLRIPVAMVKFILKILLKQILLCTRISID